MLPVWCFMSRTAKAARVATSCSAPVCSANCAPIIAGLPANLPFGCFLPAAGTPPITLLATGSSGTPAVKTDSLFAGSQALSDALGKHQIKLRFALSDEGHVWRNWRNYLADFVPQRFR